MVTGLSSEASAGCGQRRGAGAQPLTTALTTVALPRTLRRPEPSPGNASLMPGPRRWASP